jgi:transmembrane sensor
MSGVGRESSRDDARAGAPLSSTGDDGAPDDSIADAALDWFVRLRNATPAAAEQAAFQAWLQQSPRHAEALDELEAIWGSSAFITAARSLPVAGMATHARRTDQPRPRAKPLRKLGLGLGAIAATLIIAAGIWQAPALLLRWQADYITAVGDQATIALPDGSTMILNTASAVALDFADGRRNVRLLQGEAFFDVLHDPAHPFRVAGRFGAVEVKGTAFSVRGDATADTIILERGRVEVSLVANAADRATLAPDQQIVAGADTLSAVAPSDPAMALAWRQGRIAFDDQPFAKVLDELRRYRSAPVIVAGNVSAEFRVSGNYNAGDIDGALRSLADAAGVSLTTLPGGIIILR